MKNSSSKNKPKKSTVSLSSLKFASIPLCAEKSGMTGCLSSFLQILSNLSCSSRFLFDKISAALARLKPLLVRTPPFVTGYLFLSI